RHLQRPRLRARLPPAVDGQASSEARPTVLPPDLTLEMKGELLRQRGDLEHELRELDPPVADHLMEEASLRMLDLELQEKKLLRDYSESNRQVQDVREQIAHVN